MRVTATLRRSLSKAGILQRCKEYREMASNVQKERHKLKEEAQKFFLNNDKYMASELAGKAQSLKIKADLYNSKAAKLCFQYYNANLNSNLIDLHGLTTAEAKYYLGEYMQQLIQRNQPFFEVYVGRGNGSLGGPKLSKTLYEFCLSLNVYCKNLEPGRWYVNMNMNFEPFSW